MPYSRNWTVFTSVWQRPRTWHLIYQLITRWRRWWIQRSGARSRIWAWFHNLLTDASWSEVSVCWFFEAIFKSKLESWVVHHVHAFRLMFAAATRHMSCQSHMHRIISPRAGTPRWLYNGLSLIVKSNNLCNTSWDIHRRSLLLYISLSFIFPWSRCKIKISVYLSQSSINHRLSSDQTQSDRFRLWTPVFTDACAAYVKLRRNESQSEGHLTV